MKMKPAWEWIYELAAHPSQFPYLKHVAVLELKNLSGEMARGARAYKPDVSVDWDPPLELKKAFEDKGMELRIQIRGKEVAVSTRQERDNSSVIAA
jgi:hypothetical protein